METIGCCRIKDLGTDEALDVCWRPGAPNDSLSRPGAGFDDGWHWFLIGGAYWRRTESVPSKQKANRSVGFVECFTRGILVGREGIEPSTNGLRVRCSTN